MVGGVQMVCSLYHNLYSYVQVAFIPHGHGIVHVFIWHHCLCLALFVSSEWLAKTDLHQGIAWGCRTFCTFMGDILLVRSCHAHCCIALASCKSVNSGHPSYYQLSWLCGTPTLFAASRASAHNLTLLWCFWMRIVIFLFDVSCPW